MRLEDQLRTSERLADRHGFTVVGKFSDAAISGGTTQRPGYQEMLSAARRREFDVIVAEDTSRLWRTLAEQSPRLAELSDLGIAVVTHDLDTRHESAEIMGAIGGAMASTYRKEIGRRTRRGLEGVARAGKSAGGKAFGYVPASQSGTGEVEIDRDQAAIVTRIFEWYLAGWSPTRIAAELNAAGVPSPDSRLDREQRRKGKWLCSAISADPKRGTGILGNEMYAGRVIWNRSKWTRSAADSSRRKQTQNLPSEWIIHQEERLRIVSDDLWKRVQARRKERTHIVGERVARGLAAKSARHLGRPPRYTFSGLLRCAHCGGGFTVVDRAYGCASHKYGGSAACPNDARVRRAQVETGLLAGIQTKLLAPEFIDEFKERVRRRLTAPKRTIVSRTARIAELTAETGRIAEAIASGLLKPSVTLGERLAIAEAELAQLCAAQEAPSSVCVEEVIPRMADEFRQLVEELPTILAEDPDRSRMAIKQIVGDFIQVEVDEREVRFYADKQAFEVSMLRAAGAKNSLHLEMVAGA